MCTYFICFVVGGKIDQRVSISHFAEAISLEASRRDRAVGNQYLPHIGRREQSTRSSGFSHDFLGVL